MNNSFQKAFTAIEILVAVAVFSMALLPLLYNLYAGLSETQVSLSKIIATQIVSELIEQTRLMPFETLPEKKFLIPENEGTFELMLNNPQTTLFHSKIPEGFSRELEITRVSTRLKQITARSSWNVKGRQVSIKIDTLVTMGMNQ